MEIDLFKDFTKNNILNWLQELVLFLKHPRVFVTKIVVRKTEQIFSQYLFYFLIYTFSYLLTTNSSDFNTLIRPSILDLFFCVPVLILLMLSSKIATGRSHTKPLFAFVVTLYLIYSPINLFLFTLHLTQENYFFLFLQSILSLVFFIYLFYGFSFIIQISIKTGLKILCINLLLIGLGYLLLEEVALKLQKGEISINSNDLISQEYKSFINGILRDEHIPVPIAVMSGKEKIKTFYGLIAFGSKSKFQLNSDSIKNYQNNTLSNINYIKSKINKLKFNRNIEAAKLLLDYNELILQSITKSYFENTNTALDNALYNNKMPGMKLHNNIELDTRLIRLGNSTLVYNNQIIKLHNINERLIDAQRISLFLPGYLLSGTLRPDSIPIPNERFLRYND